MNDQPLMIMTNMPDASSADAMARRLVEQKLAACVNIVPAVESVYAWHGRIETSSEVTLIIKTVEQRYGEIEAAISAGHPYDVPEVIALPIVRGSAAYLQWVIDETRTDAKE